VVYLEFCDRLEIMLAHEGLKSTRKFMDELIPMDHHTSADLFESNQVGSMPKILEV